MTIKNITDDVFITRDFTLLETLKKMDKTGKRLCLIVEKGKFFGLISIGDIQRAIINNLPLNTKIDKIKRNKIKIAHKNDDFQLVKKSMLERKIECMPVVDSENNLTNVIFWNDIVEGKTIDKEKINIPVIIMAGGKGTRMRPLTNVIPKPLIPIDDKTIAEHIIDNFKNIGCHQFYFSVNYKAAMIKEYFEKITNKDYEIEFFEENKPLGTAGSLHLLENKINGTFFVSNCDIIVNDDYREIYNYHKEYDNELTIVASFRHYPIPYGTIETGERGELLDIQEKPELSFLINSGMYILEPHLIEEIPKNQFFHITDLIVQIKQRGGRVGVFPVSEKSWIDIGEWGKYLERINRK